MYDFEWIIMRQKDGRWLVHKRLDNSVTEEQARQIAIDVAKRNYARVTLLSADEYQVAQAFHVTAAGIGAMPRVL